ncbi:hypothetical protein GQ53DRAFT_744562 [Thozetella sp. PMI_491]|nr:hypothetical protein GQ53DRAFT_744562 [Thozetella sp. PMI_491]
MTRLCSQNLLLASSLLLPPHAERGVEGKLPAPSCMTSKMLYLEKDLRSLVLRTAQAAGTREGRDFLFFFQHARMIACLLPLGATCSVPGDAARRIQIGSRDRQPGLSAAALACLVGGRLASSVAAG